MFTTIWVIFLNFITLAIISKGLLIFPYVPGLFGLGSGENSLRGRFVLLLIYLFVPLSIGAIVMSWQLSSRWAYLPFLLILVAYLLGLNKRKTPGQGNISWETRSFYLKHIWSDCCTNGLVEMGLSFTFTCLSKNKVELEQTIEACTHPLEPKFFEISDIKRLLHQQVSVKVVFQITPSSEDELHKFGKKLFDATKHLADLEYINGFNPIFGRE